MISVKNNTVSVSGSKLTLLGELTGIMQAMLENDVFSKSDLEMCVRIAVMSPEEMEKSIKEGMSDLFDMLMQSMNEE